MLQERLPVSHRLALSLFVFAVLAGVGVGMGASLSAQAANPSRGQTTFQSCPIYWEGKFENPSYSANGYALIHGIHQGQSPQPCAWMTAVSMWVYNPVEKRYYNYKTGWVYHWIAQIRQYDHRSYYYDNYGQVRVGMYTSGNYNWQVFY